MLYRYDVLHSADSPDLLQIVTDKAGTLWSFVPGNNFADIELAWGLRDDNFIFTVFVVCG